MNDDTAKLLVQIDATAALLQTELSDAQRKVAAFERATGRSLAKVDANFDKAGKGAGKFERQMATLKGGLSGLAAGFGGGLIATLTGGAITTAINNAINLGDQIGDMAEQIGVSAEFLQEFRYAAEEFGGSVEGADNALGKFNLSLGKAQQGNKSAMAAYAALGVSVTDASGKARSAEAVYRDVADAIARVEDPTRQAALAMPIFGKGFQEIIGLLRQGAAGLDLTSAKAREMGLILSNEVIENLGNTEKKIRDLNTAMSVRFSQVVGENTESIGRMADEMARLADLALGAVGAYAKFKESLVGRVSAPAINPIGNALDVGTRLFDEAAGRNRINVTPAAPTGSFQVSGQRRSINAQNPGAFFQQPMRPVAPAQWPGQISRFVAGNPYEEMWKAELATLELIAPKMAQIDRLAQSHLDNLRARHPELQAEIDAMEEGNRLALLRAEGRDREADEAELLRRVEADVARIEGLTNEERREAVALLQQMAIEGYRATEAARDRLENEQRWNDEIARRGEVDLDGVDAARSTVDEYWQKYEAKGRETQAALADTFETLFREGTGGVWRQFKAEALRAIAEIAARMLTDLFQPGALAAGGGSGGGLFGLPGLLSTIFLPGRANGGPVRKGQPYVVGERRPEIFIPDTSGMIMPRVPAQSGGAGGGELLVRAVPTRYFDLHVERISGGVAGRRIALSQQGEMARAADFAARRG